jgi:ethanolamine utilization protein EutA
MEEGTDVVGLFFKDAIYPNEKLLSIFATSLEQALPNSVAQNKPIILLFQGDLAKLLGLTIHRETTIKSNLLCLDELILEAGDWIDIGASLHEPPRQVFPVTVKSLVFNQDKKNG